MVWHTALASVKDGTFKGCSDSESCPHPKPDHLNLSDSLICLGFYNISAETKHGSHFLSEAFTDISSKVPKPLV